MKRCLALAAAAILSLPLTNCVRKRPVEVHHYHTTTRTITTPSKSASVSGGSSPESFKAVTPPSSYSQ